MGPESQNNSEKTLGYTMAVKGYLSTVDLCDRYRCHSRTLQRWSLNAKNPFPAPRMRPSGKHCLWAIEDIEEWEGWEGQNQT